MNDKIKGMGKFKFQTPELSESEIQIQVMRFLEAVVPPSKGFFYRTSPTRQRHHHPTETGMPDITMCYRGRWIGIEIKKGKAPLRAGQKVFKACIEAAGGAYYVVRSLDDIQKVMKEVSK